jgi:hypothetical protein
VNPATARYLDGPNFVAFLTAEGIASENLTETEARKFHDWKNGVRADVYSATVDRLLTRYGLPVSYLPDEVWSDEQRHHNRRSKKRKRQPTISAKKRAEGIAYLADGCSELFVSDVLGVPRTAVKTWSRMAAERRAADNESVSA